MSARRADRQVGCVRSWEYGGRDLSVKNTLIITSYFGFKMPTEKDCDSVCRESTDAAADLRLIPEFDGISQPVGEWLEKVELICELRGIKGLHAVVPLRLTGGAFPVYQQLPESAKRSYASIKEALTSAFAPDPYEAYEQFERKRLRHGEAVDVFVSELRRLAGLFGGMPDNSLACAFVSKLPDSARRALRAGARIEDMTLNQLVSRARAVLADEEGHSVAVAAGGPVRTAEAAAVTTVAAAAAVAAVKCYSCGQPNHIARNCMSGRGRRGRGAPRGGHNFVRCYSCNRAGHIASTCPENGGGEESSASVSSPVRQ